MANQPFKPRPRADVRRQGLATLAHDIDPVEATCGGEQSGLVARRPREIVLTADIRATDGLVDDVVSKIEAALEGRLSDDDLSSIIECLQDTSALSPDQILRLRIPMMKFEGLLLAVRAMGGVSATPTPD
jgi:hypothetical protein